MSKYLLNNIKKIINKRAELKYNKLKIIINDLIFYLRNRALNNDIKDNLYLICLKIYYLFSRTVIFPDYKNSYNLLNAKDEVLI